MNLVLCHLCFGFDLFRPQGGGTSVKDNSRLERVGLVATASGQHSSRRPESHQSTLDCHNAKDSFKLCINRDCAAGSLPITAQQLTRSIRPIATILQDLSCRNHQVAAKQNELRHNSTQGPVTSTQTN